MNITITPFVHNPEYVAVYSDDRALLARIAGRGNADLIEDQEEMTETNGLFEVSLRYRLVVGLNEITPGAERTATPDEVLAYGY